MASAPPGSSRYGPRIFDPHATRAGLRTLEFSGLSVASAAEHDYFAFYGIDFANRIAGVNHHFGLTEAAGFRIACHYYQLPKARGTCVLLHGYFDHAGLYGHLIEHCLNNGRNVLIWDLPGHGLSSGPQASIHSFEDYTDVLADMLELHGAELPRPLWAIGQSTGGAILMSWAFRKCRSPTECPFERMMLLAPLVRPAKWRQVKLLHTLLRRVRNNLGRSFVRNSSDDEFLDFVQVDPLQSRILSIRWVSAMRQWVGEFVGHAATGYAPLVVQGTADDTVDWRWNLPMIRQKFPRADIRMVDGAGHHLVNESRDLRAEVFAALALD